MSLQAFKQTRNVTIGFGLGHNQPLAMLEAVVAFVEKFESALANGETVPTFAGNQVRIQSGEDKGYSVSPTVTWNQGTGVWTFDLGSTGDGQPKRAVKYNVENTTAAPIDFYKAVLQRVYELGATPVANSVAQVVGQVRGQRYEMSEFEVDVDDPLNIVVTANYASTIEG